jgi:ABC-type dipeptide/oligopeptide/nickel transport system ATPase component
LTDKPQVLEVTDLTTRFDTQDGMVHAVNGVSFSLKKGEFLGVVGESGSGKSVTMMSMLRLIPIPPGIIASGEAIFDDSDLLQMDIDELRRVRGGRIGFIFQDPMTSLNPVLTVGLQIKESLKLHQGMSEKEADARAEVWRHAAEGHDRRRPRLQPRGVDRRRADNGIGCDDPGSDHRDHP